MGFISNTNIKLSNFSYRIIESGFSLRVPFSNEMILTKRLKIDGKIILDGSIYFLR